MVSMFQKKKKGKKKVNECYWKDSNREAGCRTQM